MEARNNKNAQPSSGLAPTTTTATTKTLQVVAYVLPVPFCLHSVLAACPNLAEPPKTDSKTEEGATEVHPHPSR